MRSFVYVIGRANGPVKIGMSRDPERRRRELQPGSSFELKVLHVREMSDSKRAHHIEQGILSAYREDRLSGEWMAFDLYMAIEAIDMVVSTDDYFRNRALLEGVSWPC